MPVYWRLKSVPELSSLPDAKQKEVWLRSFWYGLYRPRALAVHLGLDLLVIGALLTAFYGHPLGPAILVIGFPVACILLGVSAKIVALNHARPQMRQILEAEKYSRYCRECQYNLSELTANRCPECGTEFDPAQEDTFVRWVRQPWTRSFSYAWTNIGSMVWVHLAAIAVLTLLAMMIRLLFSPL